MRGIGGNARYIPRIMKWLAYFLMTLGVINFVLAARDESRGWTIVTNPSRTASLPQMVRRSVNPKIFRGAMQYKWARATIYLLAGLAIRAIVRRADSLDPFSPNFIGSKSIDELGEELQKEEEKRHERLSTCDRVGKGPALTADVNAVHIVHSVHLVHRAAHFRSSADD